MTAVFDLLAPPKVIRALHDEYRGGTKIRARCPFCDPERRRGKSLSADLVTGFGRDRNRPGWKCWRCNVQEHPSVWSSAARWRDSVEHQSSGTAPSSDERAAKIIDDVNSRPIRRGDAADRYLRSRGLVPVAGTWPAALFFAMLRYPDEAKAERKRGTPWKEVPKHPAMVAKMSDVRGRVVALQRTFLTSAGDKAAFDEVRLFVGPTRGLTVRMASIGAGGSVALTEGVEDALSVALMWPHYGATWACLGTSGLRSVELPAAATDITIIADSDPPGLAAAKAAARRLAAEGRTVRIRRHPTAKDPNDALRRSGRSGGDG